MKDRDLARQTWLSQQLGAEVVLRAIAGGASFRQFFRFQHQGRSYLLMDIPLDDLTTCERYLEVTDLFASLGLRVPIVYARAAEHGWVWLEDFGDQLLDKALSSENADEVYGQVMNALAVLQSSQLRLPVFGREAMAFAMKGFQSWFLEQWLACTFSHAEQAILNNTYEQLVAQALAQVQAPMHRDYHCQNLLLLDDGELGIIDFQDAKIGPVTYDLVSCLRDCYIDWPVERVDRWMWAHYQRLLDAKVIPGISLSQFTQWFDWMGLERHLKACFTFVRKWRRDGDALYMQYVPRTLHYIEQISQRYSELKGFHELLIAAILPRVKEKGTIICEGQ